MEYTNIFDSHSHYDATHFDCDRHAILSALPSKGISGIISAASSLESSELAKELAERYDYIWCSAGIHPHDAKSAGPGLEDKLAELVKYKKCVAVGETGLDYHYDFSPRDVQASVLERHVSFAAEHDIPLIIHDREAHKDILDILKRYRGITGVVHCYSGSVELTAEFLRLGFYIGFTGVITFKNARRSHEAIRAIPLDRLLIETDCPYMAPVPLRGKRCDSSMLTYTAAAMAGIKGVSVQELIDQTTKNACDLFRITIQP